MDEDIVTLELSVSDLHSVLSVLKHVVNAEKEKEDGDTEIIETLTLLYEHIDQQLEDIDGQGHAQGLYPTSDGSVSDTSPSIESPTDDSVSDDS